MSPSSLLLAVILGMLQGIFEWLPISSEGNVALVLAALGASPGAAVRYALFLHLGTALAATTYYRWRIVHLLWELPRWRSSPERADISFLVLATLVSGIVGMGSYVLLIEFVSALEGGAFVALIGGLLIVTGVVQRLGAGIALSNGNPPGLLDAFLVGVGQGLAILPGVSRSGTTVSLLLLRGHDGETSFELSFLLSIPAAVGAAVLVIIEGGTWLSGGAVVALLASTVVGYATLDVLMRFARRVAFWAVCVVLGMLAIAGGLLVYLA